MKKLTAIFGSCLFFFIVMCMYLMLDQFSGQLDHDSFIRETQKAANSVKEIRFEVDKLKENLDFSNRAIDTMNDKVDDMIDLKKDKDPVKHIKFEPAHKNHEEAEDENAGVEMCIFTNKPSGHTQDVRMQDVFQSIPFDNQDGGVWKQGWPVTYEESSFKDKKLLVFVMPHSHNDPGWLKTVMQYFNDQTVKILSNVIEALAKDEKRKFIWAEISYFSMWWDRAEPRKKQMAQEQIKNGQLEIVTGGWVMNDEANPHYFNIIEQLVEGHQWLENHLGVKPAHSWSIDPFGYSPTQAYLLKRMGFKAMLIQRVHYNVKKYLAHNKYLEFMWRQNWDHGDTTDIFTHMMPFYSYDVPHTCGPDPKVCCQFDFRRLSGGGVSCPWHIPPKEINENNVKERATTLLDQYKKKAQLYRSNIVLAPLGDDFRYDKEFETRAQYDNYERIINYVNQHPELNAEIKFGTLHDYFVAIANREDVQHGEKPEGYPTLGGDFFTYADRDDHYWSGYFTSRSFYKHMDRELAAHLRAAEIIFSLALAHSRHHGRFPSEHLYPKLLASRKELSLFQHHDGITGTSKDHVVNDYAERMLRSIKDSIKVMEISSHYLLTSKKDSYQEPQEHESIIKFMESRASHDSLPIKDTVIISNQPKLIVFYNSLAQKRSQTVYVHVSEKFVQVLDSTGKIVPHQISLLWKPDRLSTAVKKYELSFVAIMPPLGLAKFEVKRVSNDLTDSLAKTEVYNIQVQDDIDMAFSVKRGIDSQIITHNQFLTAKFNGDDGLLTDVKLMEKEHKLQIRFMKYGTVGRMDRSGAYLFLPSGQAQSIPTDNPPVTVTKGKIYTEIVSKLTYVTHKVKLYHSNTDEAHGLDINNILDIRQTSNFEFVMRIETDIKNKDKEFFTDLNGFQMQRRLTLAKLPLQANFYPAPAMIYIQDSLSRLTLQTQQANGVASLETGYIEVVMDRRLMQDDNRGLGQGVTDNKITPSNFRLHLENFANEVSPDPKPSPISYPSVESITLANQLQYPVYSFLINSESNSFLSTISGLKKPLPCDLHLVNLKSLQDNIKQEPNDVTAMFLHRIGYDCRFKCRCSERRLTFQDIFEPLTVNNVEETSLSLMYSKKHLDASDRINVSPMEINTYKIKLT